jgi:phage terminase large subunit GpA-like protein
LNCFLRRFLPGLARTPIQPPSGPGYCHFPIAYQQEFFNQLTAEEIRTRFVRASGALLVQTLRQKKRGA